MGKSFKKNELEIAALLAKMLDRYDEIDSDTPICGKHKLIYRTTAEILDVRDGLETNTMESISTFIDRFAVHYDCRKVEKTKSYIFYGTKFGNVQYFWKVNKIHIHKNNKWIRRGQYWLLKNLTHE